MAGKKDRKDNPEDVLTTCPSCKGKGSLKALKIVEGKLRRNILQECRRCKGTGKISEYQELIRPRIKIARTGEPTVYETRPVQKLYAFSK